MYVCMYVCMHGNKHTYLYTYKVDEDGVFVYIHIHTLARSCGGGAYECVCIYITHLHNCIQAHIHAYILVYIHIPTLERSC